MSNKFKVKKKLASIALALSLAVQPLSSFPMNVFAGTGKNGVIKAPTLAANFDIDKIIELESGAKFDVNKYVTIISPQGATVSYNVESQTAFSGSGNLLDDAGQVQNPGIAKVKVTVGGASKEIYVIADINEMLSAADAAYNAMSGKDDRYAAWAGSYKTAVDDVVSAIVGDYKTASEQQKKDWLNAAYAAVKAAKKMTDGKGLDLEAKLKIAYMAYRIAQFTWLYNTNDSNKDAKAGECKVMADALQKVIDSLYSDKVGDIEAQAKAQASEESAP